MNEVSAIKTANEKIASIQDEFERDICRAYVEDEYSAAEIAQLMGIDVNKVNRALDNNDIKRRSRSEAAKVRANRKTRTLSPSAAALRSAAESSGAPSPRAMAEAIKRDVVEADGCRVFNAQREIAEISERLNALEGDAPSPRSIARSLRRQARSLLDLADHIDR